MRVLICTLIFTGFFAFTGKAQFYFPNEQYYTGEIDRFFLKDSAKNYTNSHLSIRPILDKRTNCDSIYYKNSKHYYWITQKIFKENFLIFKGEDFWCSVDPVIDLEGGADFAADSLDLLYWNTRGLRVQAKFLGKISFSTLFYENQALLPQYVSNFVDAHGEYRVSGNTYTQENAVIPGYARTKPFKTTGYDFAFAEGNVSIVPNKWVNFQFGNGNQFIGNGSRSLLLSDFTVNYPFAKVETNLWNGRIQYNAIYAVHQNLYRIPFFESVEASFERKIGTYHYLDVAITPNFQVGLFEGAVWKRTDSLGTHTPNWLFLNPVPFVNGAVMAKQTAGYNAVFGMNLTYTFLNSRAYGQIVLDQGKFGGAQLGLKSYNLFVPNLDLQVEFNHSPLKTYLAEDKRYNYSHYNLPLAHPLTSGFNESILALSYQYKGFFVTNRTTFYNQKYNDSLPSGIDILNDQLNTSMGANTERNVLLNNLEIGYRFNKNYNLQAVIGWQYRQEQTPGNRDLTSYVYGGIRTRIRNKTLDF